VAAVVEQAVLDKTLMVAMTLLVVLVLLIQLQELLSRTQSVVVKLHPPLQQILVVVAQVKLTKLALLA
jgi:hypothetical protein